MDEKARPERCRAKSKQSGKRCRRFPHPGKDVCIIHGALTPIKHGMRSKYAKTTFREAIQQARDDPKLLDMREQVAVIVALQGQLIEKIQNVAKTTPEQRSDLVRVTEAATNVIDRYERTQNRPGDFIPKVVIGHVIDAFADAVNLNVSDPAERARMIEAIERILDIKVMAAR